METVEDLVVGEEAHLQRAVDEALVQRAVDRGEGDGPPVRPGRGGDAVRHRQVLGVCRRTAAGPGVENISQACRLLLAVGEDVEPVPLEEVVAEGLRQEVEVLVEEGLRGGGEADRRPAAVVLPGRFGDGTAGAELDAAEVQGVAHPARGRDEQSLPAEGLLQLALFHLRLSLQLLRHGLRGEPLLVNPVYGIAHIEEVLESQHGVFRQEMQERHLLFRQRRQFGYDLHPLQLPVRELRLHLERADGLDVVAEEVDAERQLVRVGIHVDDAAAHGELPRFVDIVGLAESERPQGLFHLDDAGVLSDGQRQPPFVQLPLRHHQLRQGRRLGHDEERQRALLLRIQGGEPRQHLRPQYLVAGIALPVLHSAPVGRGIEEHIRHPVLAVFRHGDRPEVVIEIAGLIAVVQHEDGRRLPPFSDRCKEHRGRRRHESLQENRLHRRVFLYLPHRFCLRQHSV